MSAQSYEEALNALYRGLGLAVVVRYVGSHYEVVEQVTGGRFALRPADVVREIDAIRADMRTCVICGGDGRISAPDHEGWTRVVTCPVCGGFGAVPRNESA